MKGSPSPAIAAKLSQLNTRYLMTMGGALGLVLITTFMITMVSELHTLNTHVRGSFGELTMRVLENKRASEDTVNKLTKVFEKNAKGYTDEARQVHGQVEKLNANVQSVLKLVRASAPGVKPDDKTCEFGVATVVARRVDANGTEVEYWPDLFDKYPGELGVVAVLNRLGRSINHTAITHILVPQSKEPYDFDPEVLMRPLKLNFNDTLDRVRWRSKIVLDFVRIVRFVGDRCKYVLWIEDDVRAPDNWLAQVRVAAFRDVKTWAFIYLAGGMPAVLLNTLYLEYILQYLTHHFDDMPVDWLLDNCFDELKKKLTNNTDFSLMGSPMKMGIFGHRGSVSSLSSAAERPVY